MTKRMLIDATHAEETRVVVLDGTRLEDFDVETSTKKQLKGNIYLAKVVRVEPSLQAAFVEYGGNRHGFLAFSEIHPDYYQIPVADRQRLLELQAEEARREEEEAELELALSHTPDQPEPDADDQEAASGDAGAASSRDAGPEAAAPEPWALPATPLLISRETIVSAPVDAGPGEAIGAVASAPGTAEAFAAPVVTDAVAGDWARPSTPRLLAVPQPPVLSVVGDDDAGEENDDFDAAEDAPPPEILGGADQDSADDSRERRLTSRFLRNYKIQEVIRRRQILLVQVVKEERGTKGAALTTYLSLAGRFGVLMPNSPRGGGISRKITSAADRRRLKEVMAELDIPRGMGLIVRTAGANRPKPEIKRDFEYLLRLWDDIREHTLKSVAPALIYEEASLIKRAIRDVYSRDIDEILVDGEEGWRAAHEFMRMLMPSHAKKVQLWRDASSPGGQPLFARSQVEAQLDAMLSPTVQLRSGGYLVINQTEALVAIDVNSGRSTRERNVEETALRTNLEAADEAARQLRLRDLAGLIVIDFIDMESKRHNAMVERRIKEALKNDRARIQVGHISHFGLLEMSRQRLRPSLAETSFIPCPHCGGTGHVRSTENAAIHVLRGIEDEGGKRRAAEIVVHCATPIALYLLNHKRERLREIELRYHMHVIIAADDTQTAAQFRIDRVRARAPEDFPVAVTPDRPVMVPPPADIDAEEEDLVASEDEEEGDEEARTDSETADGAEDGNRRRRRRRRRRGGRREDETESAVAAADEDDAAGAETGAEEVGAEADIVHAAPREAERREPETEMTPEPVAEAVGGFAAETREGSQGESQAEASADAQGDEESRARRRGRRGGRRRRREGEGEISPLAIPGAEQPDIASAYVGPTPANPFGGQVFDIFDVMEQVEMRSTPPKQQAAAIVNVSAPEPEPEATPGPVSDEAPVRIAFAPKGAIGEGAVGAPTGQPAGAEAPGSEASAAGEANPTAPPADAPVLETAVADVGDVAADAAQAPAVDTPVPAASVEIHNAAAPEPDSSEPDSSVTAVGPASSVADNDAEPESSPQPAPHIEPPPPTPAILPILVGAGDAPAAEKKRGWWRR
ncbi:ribonuclease E/G [Rhodopila sp.]|uniref:ribonuclease E/G n=1 Tax=Rhodopila sp. TaxID=2480087 RepID=UPI002CE527BC|nr:Rne/Rng family ribonuclease [Rhodopila sp.]HVZ08440.1 Rne/Rng family ribonuclease [Rhodopila sp.]